MEPLRIRVQELKQEKDAQKVQDQQEISLAPRIEQTLISEQNDVATRLVNASNAVTSGNVGRMEELQSLVRQKERLNATMKMFYHHQLQIQSSVDLTNKNNEFLAHLVTEQKNLDSIKAYSAYVLQDAAHPPSAERTNKKAELQREAIIATNNLTSAQSPSMVSTTTLPTMTTSTMITSTSSTSATTTSASSTTTAPITTTMTTSTTTASVSSTTTVPVTTTSTTTASASSTTTAPITTTMTTSPTTASVSSTTTVPVTTTMTTSTTTANVSSISSFSHVANFDEMTFVNFTKAELKLQSLLQSLQINPKAAGFTLMPGTQLEKTNEFTRLQNDIQDVWKKVEKVQLQEIEDAKVGSPTISTALAQARDELKAAVDKVDFLDQLTMEGTRVDKLQHRPGILPDTRDMSNFEKWSVFAVELINSLPYLYDALRDFLLLSEEVESYYFCNDLETAIPNFTKVNTGPNVRCVDFGVLLDRRNEAFEIAEEWTKRRVEIANELDVLDLPNDAIADFMVYLNTTCNYFKQFHIMLFNMNENCTKVQTLGQNVVLFWNLFCSNMERLAALAVQIPAYLYNDPTTGTINTIANIATNLQKGVLKKWDDFFQNLCPISESIGDLETKINGYCNDTAAIENELLASIGSDVNPARELLDQYTNDLKAIQKKATEDWEAQHTKCEELAILYPVGTEVPDSVVNQRQLCALTMDKLIRIKNDSTRLLAEVPYWIDSRSGAEQKAIVELLTSGVSVPPAPGGAPPAPGGTPPASHRGALLASIASSARSFEITKYCEKNFERQSERDVCQATGCADNDACGDATTELRAKKLCFYNFKDYNDALNKCNDLIMKDVNQIRKCRNDALCFDANNTLLAKVSREEGLEQTITLKQAPFGFTRNPKLSSAPVQSTQTDMLSALRASMNARQKATKAEEPEEEAGDFD